MPYISSMTISGVTYQIKDTESRQLITEINQKLNTLNVQMRVHDGYIQYTDDGSTWTNLIAVEELRGENGSNGKDGGYYTPKFEQITSNTLRVTFEASDPEMPTVDPVTITLPTSGGSSEVVPVGSVSPEQVIFTDDVYTTSDFGRIKAGGNMVKMLDAGSSMADFVGLLMEEQTPEVTSPAVTLAFAQAKSYEVGTKLTPTYTATFDPGAYSFGPDETGVEVENWEITDTAGNSSSESSGSFAELQVIDGMSYKITAKATHSIGDMPLTNTGNEYPDGQIQAGTVQATSGAVTGYRNSFYGTLTEKKDIDAAAIRGLSKSGKTLANGSSFTVQIPVGALRVVIAYPATLRDVNSIKDVNGLNAEISSGFAQQIVSVVGANDYTAIDYKVYVMDFAQANDTANKFTVTI